jgi:DNA gyrase subunit B
VEPSSEYSDPETIQVLPPLEFIRKRPQFYVGPLPNPVVINRLIEGALCLSLDEAVCGHCTAIAIAVHPTGGVTIRDNGPGLPMEPGPTGRILAEVLLTMVGACRDVKRNDPVRKACCNLSLVVVNALSERLRIRVFRDGGCWVQEYQAGVVRAPFRREGDSTETGLELSFEPDGGLLGSMHFDGMALAAWLPTVGVRFESLEHHLADASADEPELLHFHGVGPHPGNLPPISARPEPTR